MTEEAAVPEAAINLVEEGGILIAVCCPSANTSLDAASVNGMIAAKGFGNLFIYPDAVDDLVAKHNEGCESFSIRLGERRDASFSISIPAGRMEVLLTATSAFGGRTVTSHEVYQALQQKGVIFGILHENISTSIAEGRADGVLIAAGIPAIPGQASEFVSLIPDARPRYPTYNETDTIDYRNLGDIITVKPGDPLMRRLPPGQGQPGRDVTGQELSAPDGADLPFPTELPGAVADADDPDLLVAAVAGQPVIVPHGVIVEPVISVKVVDLSTGNLNVDGTLKIASDIKAGMKVKATGDIVVGGVVEAARIESGGDVQVNGGIVGQSEGRSDHSDTDSSMAVVHAVGSVRALYVENACVVAGADIMIQEVVMKCNLNAGNRIAVGEAGSGKGRMIGGHSHATAEIHTGVAGSRAGVCTDLEVGIAPELLEKTTHVCEVIAAKERELEEVKKSLAYVLENKARFDETAAKEKKRQLDAIRTEIQGLQGQKRRLQRRTELVQTATITVERTAFSGVRVKVGEKALLLEEDMENVTFRLGDEGISY